MNLADVPDEVPIDFEGEMAQYRALAASVIQRAVDDLQMTPARDAGIRAIGETNEAVFTALQFFFGRRAECGGWAGMLGFTPEAMQRGVIRLLERQQQTPDGSRTAAGGRITASSVKAMRNGATRALARIAEYNARQR